MMRDALQKELDRLVNNFPLPNRRKNANAVLGEIYLWQEMAEYAARREKEEWAAAQEQKLVPVDDKMRKKGAGTHILGDTDNFSIVAKVSKPRESVDMEAFMTALANRFKCSLSVILKLRDNSKVEGKAALSKSVQEAE